MHDESANRERERAFAAFLDNLAAGEPGEVGVDPALAETARDLHDRAARSTVSAPPAGTLASIRADLFRETATPGRHRAALGLVPFPSLLSRPATQIALTAAILLALVTGFAAFRDNGWLAHTPTSTHMAYAASAAAPLTTGYTVSAKADDMTGFTAPGAATPSANAACTMPDAQAITLPVGRDGQYITGAWGLGALPLWLVGIGRTPAWYHPTDPGFVVSGTNAPPRADLPPGARINVLWLMDPRHPQPVNVRGHGIDNDADLSFHTADLLGADKEASFTPGGSTGTIYMWWTTITYTQPGCYEITATWASGSWTIRLPLPPPANEGVAPAGCSTPGATPGLLQTPGAPAHLLTQPRPPLATVEPGPPGITPGIQQIMTPPGIPLITPTPFATVIGVATPAGTPPTGCT